MAATKALLTCLLPALAAANTVTVTFPDKDQAVFHIECLYRYREVMEPRSAQ